MSDCPKSSIYSVQKLSSGEGDKIYKNFKNESNDSLDKLQQHKDISLVGKDIEIDQSKIGKDTINHSALVLKPLLQGQAETSQFNKTIDKIEKGENKLVESGESFKKKQQPFLYIKTKTNNLDTVVHRNPVKDTKCIPEIDNDSNDGNTCCLGFCCDDLSTHLARANKYIF